MTLSEISKALQNTNATIDSGIKVVLNSLKLQAIQDSDEKLANILWCYETIYEIENLYITAYAHLKKACAVNGNRDAVGYDSEKAKEYEKAWLLLDECDILIGSLEKNFCIDGLNIDDFHIQEILDDIKRLQPLFPYKVFGSRETIIKAQKCSICGKTISVRNPCGHIPGRIYMGEMCSREITDFEFLNINLVSKPFDKYSIIKPEGALVRFDYLDYIVPHIKPFMKWTYTKEKRLRPEYDGVERNKKCPCGSGMKYKHCIRKNPGIHYMDHYKFLV